MNQRMVYLEIVSFTETTSNEFTIVIKTPPNANIAPPGFYMLFVSDNGKI